MRLGRRRASTAATVALTLALGLVLGQNAVASSDDEERPFWSQFLKDHWKHVVLVLAATELDHLVDAGLGPRDHPLFFQDPPNFDREITERFGSSRSSSTGGFLQAHATPVTDGLAAAVILSSNGSGWRADATDFIGLWEAQRFNFAATGLVKDAVGRERPKLELAEERDPTSPQTIHLDGRPDQHRSFYSYHASSAFTTVSYTDLVLSRRLELHPAARRWARAGLYAIAGFVSWQRVVQEGHWFSDVVAGAFAGTYTGRSFYSFNHDEGVDRWLSWDPRRRARVSLSFPEISREGAILTARVSF